VPSLFLQVLLFVAAIQSDGEWRPMLIQNTLRGHAMRPAAAVSPVPVPSPR